MVDIKSSGLHPMFFTSISDKDKGAKHLKQLLKDQPIEEGLFQKETEDDKQKRWEEELLNELPF